MPKRHKNKIVRIKWKRKYWDLYNECVLSKKLVKQQINELQTAFNDAQGLVSAMSRILQMVSVTDAFQQIEKDKVEQVVQIARANWTYIGDPHPPKFR